MACLGKYEHPRPFPNQRHPYPWLIAGVGDWFIVYGPAGAERIRWTLSASACEATRRYDWKPKFRTKKMSDHVLMVERIS